MTATSRNEIKARKLADFAPCFPDWKPTEEDGVFVLQHSTGAKLYFQREGNKLVVGQSWYYDRTWLLAYLGDNKDSVEVNVTFSLNRPLSKIVAEIETKLIQGFPQRYSRLKQHHLNQKAKAKKANQHILQLAEIFDTFPSPDKQSFNASLLTAQGQIKLRVQSQVSGAVNLYLQHLPFQQAEAVLRFLRRHEREI